MFFADRIGNKGRGGNIDVDEALKVCAACPVTKECLEYALTINERDGVLGGTTPSQRRRLRRAA